MRHILHLPSYTIFFDCYSVVPTGPEARVNKLGCLVTETTHYRHGVWNYRQPDCSFNSLFILMTNSSSKQHINGPFIWVTQVDMWRYILRFIYQYHNISINSSQSVILIAILRHLLKSIWYQQNWSVFYIRKTSAEEELYQLYAIIL